MTADGRTKGSIDRELRFALVAQTQKYSHEGEIYVPFRSRSDSSPTKPAAGVGGGEGGERRNTPAAYLTISECLEGCTTSGPHASSIETEIATAEL